MKAYVCPVCRVTCYAEDDYAGPCPWCIQWSQQAARRKPRPRPWWARVLDWMKGGNR